MRKWVQALGVKHLVVGHQPGKAEFADGTHRKKGELYQKFDGLIFLIDVGMSRGVDNSHGPLLLIHKAAGKTTATAISPDGTTRLLWQG